MILPCNTKKIITQFTNLNIANINENIIDLSSDLRAKYNLPLPDYIHIATSINYGAKTFYTNDKALKKITEINIKTLT